MATSDKKSPANRAKKKPAPPERQGRVRQAGELIGDISGVAFRRFGFMQSSVIERWADIVGDRYAEVSTPESIRFPAGRKSGGTLTLAVDSAFAPLMQHLVPMIIERVNAFFGHDAIATVAFHQSRAPRKKKIIRPGPVPVPKELGEGLREVADPELRSVLESLAAGIGASEGAPKAPKPNLNIPIIPKGRIS